MANILGSRLRSLRTTANKTQAQLAQATGISVSAIKSYENGWREPNSKALVALERYFNVSGEYLRGDCEERRQWDDPAIMEAVHESFPNQVVSLYDILQNCSDQEQKLAFDILVELSHVLKLQGEGQRAVSISLLQSIFAASTRYIDVCVNAVHDIEPAARIDQAKRAALSQYSQALDDAFIFLSR